MREQIPSCSLVRGYSPLVHDGPTEAGKTEGGEEREDGVSHWAQALSRSVYLTAVSKALVSDLRRRGLAHHLRR